jgi:hypothetical protein
MPDIVTSKRCPLHKSFPETGARCIQEDCAWWNGDKKSGECSIKTISEKG